MSLWKINVGLFISWKQKYQNESVIIVMILIDDDADDVGDDDTNIFKCVLCKLYLFIEAYWLFVV